MNSYQDNSRIFPLTHLIIQYQKKEIPYENFHKAVCAYIYEYPQKITTRYSDYAGDFLLYMEPKIKKIAVSFIFSGVPFEKYLNITLQYQFISFIKQHILNSKKNLLYKDKSVYYSINMPIYVSENHEDMLSQPSNEINVAYELYLLLKNHSNSKRYRIRLWWIILKHSTILSDIHITDLAHLLNMPTIPCIIVLKKLKAHIQKELEKKSKIEIASNQYFGKCRFIESQLHRTSLTKHEISELRIKRDQYHKKYVNEFNKLQQMNFSISNDIIASILHVPKGSIDSGLFWLKQHCQDIFFVAREKGLI